MIGAKGAKEWEPPSVSSLTQKGHDFSASFELFEIWNPSGIENIQYQFILDVSVSFLYIYKLAHEFL